MTPAEKYAERVQLLDDNVALKETHRVPNGTKVNAFPFFEYGVTIRDAMTDFDKATEAFVRFHKEFQPDVASSYAANGSISVYEAVGMKCMRWPGNGLGENSLPQFIEYPTLEEDEYDEFWNDPAGFAFRKWLPRMCDIYEPFTKIPYMEMMTGISRAAVDHLTSPALLDTYRRLLKAAEENARFGAACRNCGKQLAEAGFPTYVGSTSCTAFDLLADGLRGTFGIMTDLMEQPEMVDKCCKQFVDYHINKSLRSFKATGNKWQWVMLHKGFDNFISDEMYAKYYWPYLRQWIWKLVEEGVTPVVFCEGAYTSRLKYLRDVPKGKVIFYFEEVDIREAKRVLGGHACIAGCFPTFTVTHGNRQKIFDQVKEHMDVLAPGGGYIFGLSASLDDTPRANVEALFEAVELFGKK